MYSGITSRASVSVSAPFTSQDCNEKVLVHLEDRNGMSRDSLGHRPVSRVVQTFHLGGTAFLEKSKNVEQILFTECAIVPFDNFVKEGSQATIENVAEKSIFLVLGVEGFPTVVQPGRV